MKRVKSIFAMTLVLVMAMSLCTVMPAAAATSPNLLPGGAFEAEEFADGVTTNFYDSGVPCAGGNWIPDYDASKGGSFEMQKSNSGHHMALIRRGSGGSGLLTSSVFTLEKGAEYTISYVSKCTSASGMTYFVQVLEYTNPEGSGTPTTHFVASCTVYTDEETQTHSFKLSGTEGYPAYVRLRFNISSTSRTLRVREVSLVNTNYKPNLLPGDDIDTFAAEVFEEGETVHELESGATFNNGTWSCSYDSADGAAGCWIYPNGSVTLNRGGGASGASMSSAPFPATTGKAYKLSMNMNMSSSGTAEFKIMLGVWAKSNETDSPSYPSSEIFYRNIPAKAKEHWDIFFVIPTTYNANRFRIQFYASTKNRPFAMTNIKLTEYDGDDFVWYENGLIEDFYSSGKYCSNKGYITSHVAIANLGVSYKEPEVGKTYTVTKALPDICAAEDESAILMAAQYKGTEPTVLNKVDVSAPFAPVQVSGLDYVRKLTLPGVQYLADTEALRVLNWNSLAEMVPLS